MGILLFEDIFPLPEYFRIQFSIIFIIILVSFLIMIMMIVIIFIMMIIVEVNFQVHRYHVARKKIV